MDERMRRDGTKILNGRKIVARKEG